MIAAIVGLCIIASIASLCLGLASRKFAIKVDPKVEKVGEELPGANCGGCGFAGCHDLAKAACENPREASRCLLITEDSLQKISGILACELSPEEKKVAVVHCRGGETQTMRKYDFDGVSDCIAAALVWEGPKMCQEGCLGFGTCVSACPFGAISMNDNYLPVIHVERCTGCRACAKACPRGVIEIHPKSKEIHVCCHSHLKGAQLKKICKVGCIGCGRCERACTFGAIHMKHNTASIDYAKCTNCGQCALVCPTKCISLPESALVLSCDQ
ncbi:MAG: RnfABCDGE type electron transport complex subunit B [bacterium]